MRCGGTAGTGGIRDEDGIWRFDVEWDSLSGDGIAILGVLVPLREGTLDRDLLEDMGASEQV